MSSAVKVVSVLVVLGVVAGGGYWVMSTSKGVAPLAEEVVNVESQASSKDAVLPSGESTADAALEQDLNAIEMQVTAFGSDNTGVDQSLKDTPVAQSTI